MTDQAGHCPLDFNQLGKFVEKSLRRHHVEKKDAIESAAMLVESLRTNKYLYTDLEEMYLGIVRHGQDPQMMIKELTDTLNLHKKNFPVDISPKKLIKYAVDFYNYEPVVQSKLKPRRKTTEVKKDDRKTKRNSKSPSPEEEKQTNKKFAKFENLRPLSNVLLSILDDYKLAHFKTKKIVGDIIERIVIAGYDWDRIRSYQSKGQDHFNKKLIPYIFMSKDDLPQELSPDVLLSKIFSSLGGLRAPASTTREVITTEKKVNNSSRASLLKYNNKSSNESSSDQESTISNILGKRKLFDSDIDLNDDELSAKVNDFIKRKDKRRRKSSLDSEEDDGEDDKRRKKQSKEERRSSSESSSDTKLKTKLPTDIKREKSPLVSDCSTDIEQMINGGESKEKQKQSLLEKVNEIIKSCVKLKTDKKITGMKLEKANKIIAKAEAKKIKLLTDSKQEEEGEEMEEDCIEVNPDENDLKEEREEKDPGDIEEGEITDDDDDDDEVSVLDVKPREARKSSVCSELQAMAGRDNRVTRQSLDRRPPRSPCRSPCRSPSWSPSHSYRKKAAVAAGNRYNHHQYRQSSRSVSQSEEEEEEEELSRWIPITPCTIQEDVEVEPMSTVTVNIKAKGEFSFKDNLGCYVRITKWTGKDSVDFLTIKPQVIKIDHSMARVEMSNTYSDKFLNILRHDKVACMSILSSPPPSAMLSRINCSPERYQSQDKKWFKVTTVVLHKKGSLDKITISPGKTLKVVGTVIGPLKKHIGRDVLVSELDVGDPVPIHSQICRITDNEKIGINISNRGKRTLVIEKTGQAIATISVWANVGPEAQEFTMKFMQQQQRF